jgi:hypothetical protein
MRSMQQRQLGVACECGITWGLAKTQGLCALPVHSYKCLQGYQSLNGQLQRRDMWQQAQKHRRGPMCQQRQSISSTFKLELDGQPSLISIFSFFFCGPGS